MSPYTRRAMRRRRFRCDRALRWRLCKYIISTAPHELYHTHTHRRRTGWQTAINGLIVVRADRTAVGVDLDYKTTTNHALLN